MTGCSSFVPTGGLEDVKGTQRKLGMSGGEPNIDGHHLFVSSSRQPLRPRSPTTNLPVPIAVVPLVTPPSERLSDPHARPARDALH